MGKSHNSLAGKSSHSLEVQDQNTNWHAAMGENFTRIQMRLFRVIDVIIQVVTKELTN